MDDWANFMGFVIKINKTVLLSAHNRWEEKKKYEWFLLRHFMRNEDKWTSYVWNAKRWNVELSE